MAKEDYEVGVIMDLSEIDWKIIFKTMAEHCREVETDNRTPVLQIDAGLVMSLAIYAEWLEDQLLALGVKLPHKAHTTNLIELGEKCLLDITVHGEEETN